MALTAVYGWQMPPMPPFAFTFNAGNLIDATGEKAAMIGRVWNKDRTSKNITKVGFRFGTVVKAGGSALTVSLQDVSTAAGPPYQPDETQDQTVAIANANASFATNTWIQAALSATRTVAYGELLAVVVEYDGAGRLGADSVVIHDFDTAVGGGGRNLSGGEALKTGGTWADGPGLGITDLVLEFDDGTFGTFLDAFPCSTTTTTNFNSGSSPNEYALEITPPVTINVDAVWIRAAAATGANFSVVLYDSASTALQTVAVDQHTLELTTQRFLRIPIPETTLTGGSLYRLALKPTTANNVTVYDCTVANANHFQAWPLGTAAVLATRAGGAWTTTTTRRPMMGFYVSAVNATDGLPASRAFLGM